jgi:hypothetical protein
MAYAEVVDRQVCPADKLRTELQAIRERVEAAGLRRLVSSRFLDDAYAMAHGEARWTREQILNKLTAGWTPEERAKARV